MLSTSLRWRYLIRVPLFLELRRHGLDFLLRRGRPVQQILNWSQQPKWSLRQNAGAQPLLEGTRINCHSRLWEVRICCSYSLDLRWPSTGRIGG